eukprot:COSAG02_NODE_33773_length_494_cov_4.463291_1_plen_42_part_01
MYEERTRLHGARAPSRDCTAHSAGTNTAIEWIELTDGHADVL